MFARLMVVLSLIVSTLPAQATGAPPCHDGPMAQMASDIAVSAHHAAPPTSDPATPRKAGDMPCVGCIAPTTLRAPTVATPLGLAGLQNFPLPIGGLLSAGWQPEPPPPRS